MVEESFHFSQIRFCTSFSASVLSFLYSTASWVIFGLIGSSKPTSNTIMYIRVVILFKNYVSIYNVRPRSCRPSSEALGHGPWVVAAYGDNIRHVELHRYQCGFNVEHKQAGEGDSISTSLFLSFFFFFFFFFFDPLWCQMALQDQAYDVYGLAGATPPLLPLDSHLQMERIPPDRSHGRCHRRNYARPSGPFLSPHFMIIW